MIKASLYIPVHNVAPYLDQCLTSALAQTLQNIEIIVVDDASTDGTAEILDRFAAAHDNIKVIHLEANGGVSAARNAALNVAQGEWLAMVDGDDWIEPERIERMIAAAERLGADWLADDLYFVQDLAPDPIARLLIDEPKGARRVNAAHLIGRDVPGHHGYGLLKPVIRRAFVEDHGLRYRPDLRHHGDFFFLVDCAAHGAKLALLNEPRYWYRKREGQLTDADSLAIITTMKRLSQRARALARGRGAHAVEEALIAREHLIDRERQYYEVIAPLKKLRVHSAVAGLARNLDAFPYIAGRLAERVRIRLMGEDPFQLVTLSHAIRPEAASRAPRGGNVGVRLSSQTRTERI